MTAEVALGATANSLPMAAVERVELDLDAPDVPVAAPTAVPDVPGPRSPVAGSLVDPAVWRTVVTLARDKTVRR